ncbi:MAG: FKBP-type peptidyl-prolyl cis-trans isomerase [Opitutaceae bacterium]|jgi:FKBP-type peptidyl-prolyl cis-trans isomerase
MKTPRILLAVSIGALALALGACSKETASSEEDASQKAGAYRISAADARTIAAKYPGVPEAPDGLRTIVLAPGAGTAKPKHGSVVAVNYELRRLDGTVIETSAKTLGGPLVIQTGMGRVIKAWDESLLDMRKGEKRTLIVPHWLGYGVTGNPPKIPPYATLVFDLELADIK